MLIGRLVKHTNMQFIALRFQCFFSFSFLLISSSSNMAASSIVHRWMGIYAQTTRIHHVPSGSRSRLFITTFKSNLLRDSQRDSLDATVADSAIYLVQKFRETTTIFVLIISLVFGPRQMDVCLFSQCLATTKWTIASYHRQNRIETVFLILDLGSGAAMQFARMPALDNIISRFYTLIWMCSFVASSKRQWIVHRHHKLAAYIQIL